MEENTPPPGMTPEVHAFWKGFEDAAGSPQRPRFYEAFHFSDSASSANALAQLVWEGRKRATASLLWFYQSRGKALPKAGDLSVVTLWLGTPVCVIETTEVRVLPFAQVDAAFAADEGEGDLSLAYWRKVHWDYFSRECRTIGRLPDEQMPVVCERFRVVYRPPATP